MNKSALKLLIAIFCLFFGLNAEGGSPKRPAPEEASPEATEPKRRAFPRARKNLFPEGAAATAQAKAEAPDYRKPYEAARSSATPMPLEEEVNIAEAPSSPFKRPYSPLIGDGSPSKVIACQLRRAALLNGLDDSDEEQVERKYSPRKMTCSPGRPTPVPTAIPPVYDADDSSEGEWSDDSSDEGATHSREDMSLVHQIREITATEALIPSQERILEAMLGSIESLPLREQAASMVRSKIDPNRHLTPKKRARGRYSVATPQTPSLLRIIDKIEGESTMQVNFDHLDGSDLDGGHHYVTPAQAEEGIVTKLYTSPTGVSWGKFQTPSGRWKVSTFYPYKDERAVVHSMNQAWERRIAENLDRGRGIRKVLGVDNQGVASEFVLSPDTNTMVTHYPIMDFITVGVDGKITNVPPYTCKEEITVAALENKENVRYVTPGRRIIDIASSFRRRLCGENVEKLRPQGLYLSVPNGLLTL